MNHEFTVVGSWEGGRAGLGEIRGEHATTLMSLPRELGGSARGTNPEEMIAATAASCFLITLGIVLEKRGVPVERLEVSTRLTLDAEKLKLTRLVHTPSVRLGAGASDEQRAALGDALLRAEKMCLISNALRGNVEISVDWPGLAAPSVPAPSGRVVSLNLN